MIITMVISIHLVKIVSISNKTVVTLRQSDTDVKRTVHKDCSMDYRIQVMALQMASSCMVYNDTVVLIYCPQINR